eukprot:TRINITY_DN23275_c0_g1_i1.p1 TRINITY_DN23275_c0_g1~~TRINITY_DN23275_c0_g1_i1.p1  ORF type:complete len:1209 (+),score=218.64 TRINITY_DN23275_c0_g1_i1:49-3675(+)
MEKKGRKGQLPGSLLHDGQWQTNSVVARPRASPFITDSGLVRGRGAPSPSPPSSPDGAHRVLWDSSRKKPRKKPQLYPPQRDPRPRSAAPASPKQDPPSPSMGSGALQLLTKQSLQSAQGALGLRRRPGTAGVAPVTAPPWAATVTQETLRAKVCADRVRSGLRAPAVPPSESDVPSMMSRDPYALGLADAWNGRWPVSRGFESLVRSIDRVLPRMEEDELGGKWRALGEWVSRYESDRDAAVVAQRCGALLRIREDGTSAEASADAGERGPQLFSPQAGFRSVAQAVGMAQRLHLTNRRRECAAGCVGLDQVLLYAAKCHPCLWPVVRRVRHVILGLAFVGVNDANSVSVLGEDEEWVEEPTKPAPVPDLRKHIDEDSVRRAVNSYARRRSWQEVAQDLQRRLGLLSADISQGHESTEKLMKVMDRGIKFWQGVVQRVLIRAWRAIRRRDKKHEQDSAAMQREVEQAWFTTRQATEDLLAGARRDVARELGDEHKAAIDGLRKQLERTERAVKVAEEERDLLRMALDNTRTRVRELTETLAERDQKIAELQKEIGSFRKLCKDFTVESLEGPTWVISRQELLKDFVDPLAGSMSFEGPLHRRSRNASRISVCLPVGTSSGDQEAECEEASGGEAAESGGADAADAATDEQPAEAKDPDEPEPEHSPMSPGHTRRGTAAMAAATGRITATDAVNSTVTDETFLLEWFNAAILNSGYPGAQRFSVNSFAVGHRLLDPYALVLHFMSPGSVPRSAVTQVLATDNERDKARLVLRAAEDMDMIFPLTPEELCNPSARPQHLLIATALLQRFADHHLSVACGMKTLLPPPDTQSDELPNPLWPSGKDPETAGEWRARMLMAFSRSMRWRGAGAAAQSLATEILLSKVQGRADKGQTVGEEAQRKMYVIDPLTITKPIDDVLEKDPAEKDAELKEMTEILGRNFRALRRVYLFYSTGDHLDVQLDQDELHRLLTDSRLTGRQGGLTRQFLDDAFRRCARDSMLDPTGYVQVLIRIAADARKGWMRSRSKADTSLSARLRMIVEDQVSAHANYADLTEFRTALHSEASRRVLDSNSDLLVACFRAYASHGRTADSKLMTIKDFQEFVASMQIIDSVLSHESVRAIFLKMQDVDSDACGGLVAGPGSQPEHVASYSEFIECVAALALYKSPAPYLPVCRRLARFVDMYLVPAFSDGRIQKVRVELQRIRQQRAGR